MTTLGIALVAGTPLDLGDTVANGGLNLGATTAYKFNNPVSVPIFLAAVPTSADDPVLGDPAIRLSPGGFLTLKGTTANRWWAWTEYLDGALTVHND